MLNMVKSPWRRHSNGRTHCAHGGYKCVKASALRLPESPCTLLMLAGPSGSNQQGEHASSVLLTTDAEAAVLRPCNGKATFSLGGQTSASGTVHLVPAIALQQPAEPGGCRMLANGGGDALVRQSHTLTGQPIAGATNGTY